MCLASLVESKVGGMSQVVDKNPTRGASFFLPQLIYLRSRQISNCTIKKIPQKCQTETWSFLLSLQLFHFFFIGVHKNSFLMQVGHKSRSCPLGPVNVSGGV